MYANKISYLKLIRDQIDGRSPLNCSAKLAGKLGARSKGLIRSRGAPVDVAGRTAESSRAAQAIRLVSVTINECISPADAPFSSSELCDSWFSNGFLPGSPRRNVPCLVVPAAAAVPTLELLPAPASIAEDAELVCVAWRVLDCCCSSGVVSSSVSVTLSKEGCRLRLTRVAPFVKTLRLQMGQTRRFSVSQGSMQWVW